MRNAPFHASLRRANVHAPHSVHFGDCGFELIVLPVSKDNGTSTSRRTPHPSTTAPLHEYHPAAGNRMTNPWPTAKFAPPSTWPPVRVPTIVAGTGLAGDLPHGVGPRSLKHELSNRNGSREVRAAAAGDR
jgi:hypothetical protein